jgi:hypothetical protein
MHRLFLLDLILLPKVYGQDSSGCTMVDLQDNVPGHYQGQSKVVRLTRERWATGKGMGSVLLFVSRSYRYPNYLVSDK